MSPTDLFIKRPVLALVISSLILLLGSASMFRVPVREFPKLEKNVIEIMTFYRGASARTVQGLVTTPLQINIAGAQGVEYITSTSSPGISRIEVHVRLGESTSNVVAEIIAKVRQARDELPKEVEEPTITTASGDDAMMYLAFYSDQMELHQVSDYLVRNVQPELATIEGVGLAAMYGHEIAMRIWLDPIRMAAFGITANDIRNVISRENYISTAGSTESNLVSATVDAKTDMQNVEDFKNLVLRQNGEDRVLLQDVADVEISSENLRLHTTSSGKPCVFMAITPAPDANPLDVSKRVHESLPEIRAGLPADVKLFLDWDGSVKIDKALNEVTKTLFEAAAIVILVIFLFLGSPRVVLIPLVAIPLSLIGVVFLISAMGFTLNLLTLLAMVIAIGLVVDDAIVVVENVHRHIELGLKPLEAALLGAKEVALPVVSMTLTLAAVYAPIAFIGGLTGTLFSEFALTLAGAVLISGIIALTLSPMMCSKVLQDHQHQGKFADWLDSTFLILVENYKKMLSHCLRNKGAIFLFSFFIFLSLPALFWIARGELAPEEDNSGFFIVGTAPRHANLDYWKNYLAEVVDTWKSVPEVSHSWQWATPSQNFGGLTLHPWSERERSQQEVMAEFQEKLSNVEGLQLFAFGEPPLPGTEPGLPVNFVVSSTRPYEEVYRISNELLERARESGLFIIPNQTLSFDRPEISVELNRRLASRLGITMEEIGTTLSTMLGESEINRFTRDGRSYKVIPQAERGFRLTPEHLEQYYIRTSKGDLVPLSSLIELSTKVQPNDLTQYQQFNSSTIQAIMMPPNTLETGLNFLNKNLEEIAPPGFRGGYTGASRRFIQEKASFPILFSLSIILIFLVLAAQFNSFRDPLVVLVSVPLSIFGAVVPIALGFATFNIYTQIGLLTLIGLISKHGILIVEFANKLIAKTEDAEEAILEASSLRLRPILMTTFATVLGVLPLILGSSAGANARFSIGLVITTGMLVGTLFTLFVLPAFYMLFVEQNLRKTSNNSERSVDNTNKLAF